MTVRVMIVDDHPIWRDALERDLTENGYAVVATAADGETAARIAPAVRPDVVLMDMQLPGVTGAQATSALVTADPGVRVLVFSASGADADVLAAVAAGARGYLVKSAPRAELLDAVRRTAAGEAVYGPGLAALVLGEHHRIRTAAEPDPATALSDREREVLRLVATGMTARDIADQLVLSHRTVQNHIQSTLRKLQLHNRVQLTRWAIDQGLTD